MRIGKNIFHKMFISLEILHNCILGLSAHLIIAGDIFMEFLQLYLDIFVLKSAIVVDIVYRNTWLGK